MLHFDKVQNIEGVTVYGDDEKDNLFYILPDSPRFRLDESGKPVFKFLKYKTPIERENVKKGGFCNFDVEFVVSPEKEQAVVAALKAQRGKDDIQVGRLTYIDGTAKLLISNQDNKIVEKLTAASAPSLYGRNITSFSLELSEIGAPIFETALQGGGGFVQVSYDLTTYARLQGATVKFTIDSESKHTFKETIKASEGTSFWHDGKYDEKIEDTVKRIESSCIKIDFGALSEEAKNNLREWAQEQFAEAVKRKIDIVKPIPADRGGNKATGGRDTESLLEILQSEDFNIDQSYAENTSIEWELHPNGTLPNITTLPGWVEADKKKYFDSISADDPFFKSLEVRSRVNADFTRLPIYNVTVLVNYDEPKSFVFTSGNSAEPMRYNRYLKEDQSRKYKYSYEVHYKNSSKAFKSPLLESDSTDLTIDLDDLGLLVVDVAADGTLDFNKVSNAKVTIRYEDPENGIKGIEKAFNLSSSQKTFTFQEVLGSPRTKPYEFQVEYTVGGKKLRRGWQPSDSSQLFIDSPFSESKTYRFIGKGWSTISTIYLDLVYEEKDNNYRQSKSVAITQNATPDPWEVQMVDPNAGKLSYSGTIQYKDGKTEDIPLTVSSVDKATIIVGKVDVTPSKLSVTVNPDLIDWNDADLGLKLATVSLKYDDDANGIHENKTLTFKKNATAAQKWEIEIKDAAKKSYQWRAAFHTTVDGKTVKKETPWQAETDTDIFPDTGMIEN